MRSQPSNYKITAQMQHIMVLSQIQVEDNNKFGCLRISIFGILRQQQVQLQRTLNWGQTRFNFIWKKFKLDLFVPLLQILIFTFNLFHCCWGFCKYVFFREEKLTMHGRHSISSFKKTNVNLLKKKTCINANMHFHDFLMFLSSFCALVCEMMPWVAWLIIERMLLRISEIRWSKKL